MGKVAQLDNPAEVQPAFQQTSLTATHYDIVTHHANLPGYSSV